MKQKENRIDVLTDINMKLIHNNNNQLHWYQFKNEYGMLLAHEYGKIISLELAEYMAYECKVIDRHRAFYSVNEYGIDIIENGGWLKHINRKKNLDPNLSIQINQTDLEDQLCII